MISSRLRAGRSRVGRKLSIVKEEAQRGPFCFQCRRSFALCQVIGEILRGQLLRTCIEDFQTADAMRISSPLDERQRLLLIGVSRPVRMKFSIRIGPDFLSGLSAFFFGSIPTLAHAHFCIQAFHCCIDDAFAIARVVCLSEIRRRHAFFRTVGRLNLVRSSLSPQRLRRSETHQSLHPLFIRRKILRITAHIVLLATGRTGETHSQIHTPRPNHKTALRKTRTTNLHDWDAFHPASRTLTAGRYALLVRTNCFTLLKRIGGIFSLLPLRIARASIGDRVENTHFTFDDQRAGRNHQHSACHQGEVTSSSFGKSR